MTNIPQNNWTPLAQVALHLATKHAHEQGHKVVSTAHLLVGLCRLGQGAHVEPLRKQAFDDSKCIVEAEGIAKQQAAAGSGGELDYSKSLIEAVQRAQEIATRLRHRFLGTEHIALTLVQADDEVGALLRDLHRLDVQLLELDILKELDPHGWRGRSPG